MQNKNKLVVDLINYYTKVAPHLLMCKEHILPTNEHKPLVIGLAKFCSQRGFHYQKQNNQFIYELYNFLKMEQKTLEEKVQAKTISSLYPQLMICKNQKLKVFIQKILTKGEVEALEDILYMCYKSKMLTYNKANDWSVSNFLEFLEEQKLPAIIICYEIGTDHKFYKLLLRDLLDKLTKQDIPFYLEILDFVKNQRQGNLKKSALTPAEIEDFISFLKDQRKQSDLRLFSIKKMVNWHPNKQSIWKQLKTIC